MNKHVSGYGLGLRTEHYQDFVSAPQPVDWLEIITENYLLEGGKPLHFLDQIRRDYPMVMHGVSLSIGSVDPLDTAYLKQLSNLVDRVDPAWVSDHLCWTGVDALNLHDLLPLPYSEAALQHLLPRIAQVQDTIGRPFLLENVSSYVSYRSDEMSEWAFIAELVKRSGCELLLDVNNVYVSSVNHGFDPKLFIDAMPAAAVRQLHMAGHENHGSYIIDTHDHPICDAVWDLYAYTLQHLGMRPVMIERDDHIPPLPELLVELATLRRLTESTLQDLELRADDSTRERCKVIA